MIEESEKLEKSFEDQEEILKDNFDGIQDEDNCLGEEGKSKVVFEKSSFQTLFRKKLKQLAAPIKISDCPDIQSVFSTCSPTLLLSSGSVLGKHNQLVRMEVTA